MSVSLIISNPINKEESNFNIPISTEQVFQECWMPIIETLNLQWIKCFQSGIELEKEDFESVLKELMEIKIWLVNNINNARKKQVIERIDNLSKELIELFENTRDDLKVYIG